MEQSASGEGSEHRKATVVPLSDELMPVLPTASSSSLLLVLMSALYPLLPAFYLLPHFTMVSDSATTCIPLLGRQIKAWEGVWKESLTQVTGDKEERELVRKDFCRR